MKSHLFAVCSRAHLCIFDRSNSPPLLACSDPALAWNNFHTEDNHRSKVLPLHFYSNLFMWPTYQSESKKLMAQIWNPV